MYFPYSREIRFLHRAITYRFRQDPSEVRYIMQHLHKGGTAIDVGSHKGGYMYWMRKSIGKSGAVYAFEPQPFLAEYLGQMTRLFGYKNVVIENLGLSDAKGEAKLFIPNNTRETSPGARIDVPDWFDDSRAIEISVTTLDEYFADSEVVPDLIKIDVEGHETKVLSGAIDLIKGAKPYLVIEREQRHLSDEAMGDMFDMLGDLGYAGYYFVRGDKMPLESFNVEEYQRVRNGEIVKGALYINNFVFEHASRAS